MRTFKTKIFHQWARKIDLSNEKLKKAISEIEVGLYDAKLGGHLIKKRIALVGKGKREGVRTIIAFQKEGRAFFMYGYAKNVRTNINAKEKKALMKYANDLFSMDTVVMDHMVKSGYLIEIK